MEKRRYRPNGAFKLLVHVLYGQYPYMERMPRGFIRLSSVRKLARRLGTQSTSINKWISWLENSGYIESVSYSEDRRALHFRVRYPTSLIGMNGVPNV